MQSTKTRIILAVGILILVSIVLFMKQGTEVIAPEIISKEDSPANTTDNTNEAPESDAIIPSETENTTDQTSESTTQETEGDGETNTETPVESSSEESPTQTETNEESPDTEPEEEHVENIVESINPIEETVTSDSPVDIGPPVESTENEGFTFPSGIFNN